MPLPKWARRPLGNRSVAPEGTAPVNTGGEGCRMRREHDRPPPVTMQEEAYFSIRMALSGRKSEPLREKGWLKQGERTSLRGRKGGSSVFLAAAKRKFGGRQKKVGRAAKESWAGAKNQILCLVEMKKRKCLVSNLRFFLVGVPGLEPGKAGPESAVLPLHHTPIHCVATGHFRIAGAKLRLFLELPKFFPCFFLFPSKKSSSAIGIFLREDHFRDTPLVF